MKMIRFLVAVFIFVEIFHLQLQNVEAIKTDSIGKSRNRGFFDFSTIENWSPFYDLEITFQDDYSRWEYSKLLFAAKSDFFRKNIGVPYEFVLKNTSGIRNKPKTMEAIGNYFKFGHLKIEDDILESVLAFANIIKHNDLTAECIIYMKKTIDEHNFVEYWKMGESFHLDAVNVFTLIYARKNFQQIVDNRTYLKMDGGFLKNVLESGKINIDDEKTLIYVRKNFCEKNPEKNVSLEDCLKSLSFTTRKWATVEEMRENLDEAISSEEFRELAFEELTELLKSDYLKASSEEKVFDGIDEWIKYDPQNRKKLRSSLLKHTRWELLSTKFILDKLDEKFTPFLEDDLREHWHNLRKIIVHKSNFTDVQSLSESRVTLIINGNYNLKTAGKIDIYNSKWKKWEPFDYIKKDHAEFSSIIFGGNLLIIGGSYGERNENGFAEATSDVWSFNFTDRKLTKLPSMNIGRLFLTATVINGNIYVCGGGLDDSNVNLTNSLEMMSPSLSRWKTLSPMKSKNNGHAAVTFDSKLFIFGGQNGNYFLNTVEIYDPKTDQWSEGKRMPMKISSCAATVYKDSIYVIGGVFNNNRFKSVYMYDPKRNTWDQTVDMIEPLSDLSAINIQGRILIAGGEFSNGSDSDKVYEYIPEIKKWSLHSTLTVTRYRPDLMQVPSKYLELPAP